jgi:hypothetical protein
LCRRHTHTAYIECSVLRAAGRKAGGYGCHDAVADFELAAGDGVGGEEGGICGVEGDVEEVEAESCYHYHSVYGYAC